MKMKVLTLGALCALSVAVTGAATMPPARVFDVAVVGGGPAGVGAALAAYRGIDPREVSLEDARRQLRALGAIVPNEIEAHLAYAHDGISGNQ